MKHKNVCELFDEAAESFPANVAIDATYKQIAYSELQARSNSLANFIISSGTPKGAIIGIMADDAIEIIIAIIGVLKAGCAFAPLETRMPESRLRAMIEEVSPELFIIESRYLSKLCEVAVGKDSRSGVICLDGYGPDGDCRADLRRLNGYTTYFEPGQPAPRSHPDDMCYVYFTSGSTGRPKAMAGRLKAIDHFIRWEINTFGIGEGTRVSQLSSISFDASLRDIFAPLCAGGTVCVPHTRDMIIDARQLTDWIDQQQINLVHCVPSLFRSILNQDLHAGLFCSLKFILLAGEPLLAADVQRWSDIFGDRVQLVNLYGPSETTMTKFFYPVKPAGEDRAIIPIGKPMQGAAAIIIDEEGRACPPGIVGEIYIRTPFRTLGYYNQPEMTREVFIQNPFSNDPNDIVYKTGDLGRVLEDGNFEFIGRRDHQVKIRGVRIELAEIENLLRGHDAVKDVVVVDRDGSDGNKYLCAYVVLSDTAGTGRLREYLSTRLPPVMLPSAFVVVDSLPRTHNGKVDRLRLPTLSQARADQLREFVAPRNEAEEALARIWGEVLGLERIGVHDNFFDLGGHSLRVIQVRSRIQRAFGVELPLPLLFEAPTVASLVGYIETTRWGEESMQRSPTTKMEEREEIEL